MVAKSPNSYPCRGFEEDLLPEDIAHHIASLLPVSDVCSLGSTSRFWRNLCNSDTLWINLSKERWPSIGLLEDSQLLEKKDEQKEKGDLVCASSSKGWKGVYIKWNMEMACRAATVARYVKECSPHESLETADIAEALSFCRISGRKICIRWWKLGQWVRGFRQRDEMRVHRMSLLDILKPEKQVLWVLEGGVVHEDLRVQISTDVQTSAWSCTDLYLQH